MAGDGDKTAGMSEATAPQPELGLQTKGKKGPSSPGLHMLRDCECGYIFNSLYLLIRHVSLCYFKL